MEQQQQQPKRKEQIIANMTSSLKMSFMICLFFYPVFLILGVGFLFDTPVLRTHIASAFTGAAMLGFPIGLLVGAFVTRWK